jgi:hypothetical protein
MAEESGESEEPQPPPPQPPRTYRQAASSGQPQQLFRVSRRVDLETVREETRSRLAQVLVALLVVVALSLVGLTAWGKLSIDQAKDLAGVVLSPLVAVTGTALGFYFGGHHGSN